MSYAAQLMGLGQNGSMPAPAKSISKGSSSLYGGKGYRGATGGIQDIKGTGYKQLSSPQFTKEQLNLFKSLFSGVGPNSQLGQLAGGNQEAFAELEAPALQQFSGLQGGLASRFSGFGGLGGRNTSGFQNTANSAASDFASQLRSQRLGIQNQARNDLFNMSQSLLGQRPFESSLIPEQQKSPGFWKSLFGGLAGGAGSALGSAATMGLGNLFGGSGQQQQPQQQQRQPVQLGSFGYPNFQLPNFGQIG